MEIESQNDIVSFLKKFTIRDTQQIKRLSLEISQTHRFYLPPKNKNLKSQYSNIYCVRYNILKSRIEHNPKDPQMIELIQKIHNQPGTIKVIGTLFKEMKLKPYYFQNGKILNNYTSPDDTCYLEDYSGRVKLKIQNCKLQLPNGEQKIINASNLITGLVIMIEGIIVANNVINVEKIHLPHLLDAPLLKGLTQQSYMCIISGFNYSFREDNTRLRNLVSFLQGNEYCGAGNEVPNNLSQILIVGNLYSPQVESAESLHGNLHMQQDFKQLYGNLSQDIKGVDELINCLAKINPIAIMPGANEPISQMLPQQPMHKAHFGETYENENELVFLPNPSEFQLGTLNILGTSGQNIQDIKKYSQIGDQTDLDILEMTLYYGHIAPTLPDTLIAYPQNEKDPFVIEELPNIYFAGNCSSFGTKKINDNLRIISVPMFSETGIIAIVNLNTLDCFSVTIQ